MTSDEAPADEMPQAIEHAVAAGACFSASRAEPDRKVWRYVGEAQSRRSNESLRAFVMRHRRGTAES